MLYNVLHKLKLSHAFGRKFLTDRFFPFKILYRLFQKLRYTKKVHRNGVTFTVLLKDGVGFMNFLSDYETWLDTLVSKLLSTRKGAFIDVGANTGQTLLKVVPRFPQTPYYAIEPNPSCVKYLEDLCQANRFNNVKIMPYALSDAAGETALQLRFKDDILATTSPLFRKFTHYSTTVKVPMTTGDALFTEEGLKEVAILKVDVEGGEWQALAGFRHVIQLHQPSIICEILPLVSKDEGVTQYRKMAAQNILSLLQELRYVAYNLAQRREVASIDELSASLESCNYLFVPAENRSLLADLG